MGPYAGLRLPSLGISDLFKRHWKNGLLATVVVGSLLIPGVPGKVDRAIDQGIDKVIDVTAPLRCATIPLYEINCNNEGYQGGEAMPGDSCTELYNLRVLCER